jgi:hypothetical protein
MQDQPAHRIGRIAAIVQQLAEVVVAADLLVLAKGDQQIEERINRDVELVDCGCQGDEYRVARVLAEAVAQLAFPPV